MHDGAAALAFLAWLILVPPSFRLLKPGWASAFAVLGGLLILPRVVLWLGPVPVDKRVVAGLALLIGILGFDFRSARKLRPRWLDLPMAAFVLAPLTGLATGIAGSGPDLANMILQRALGDLAPYLAARLYFGDPGGPRRVAVAIVVAGLATIPVCLFEEVAGPDRYLSTILYGTHADRSQVDRLGGYRPEGFLGNGLELASWMALASTMAVWIWLGPGTGSRWAPAWLAAPALIATTLSCRGVYGMITMALGIALAASTRLLRSRGPLVVLGAIPFLYMASRGSGVWDGRALVRAVTATGRSGTVGFRLDAENELIGRVLDRAPTFGFGNYVWNAGEPIRWPDGQWLHLLWSGGLVGLGVAAIGLHAFPLGLAISRPGRRPTGLEAASPLWALGCWSALGLVEMLHNASLIGPTGFVVGAIVGSAPTPEGSGPTRSSARTVAGPARSVSIVPVVVTALALTLVEVLGRLPRPAGPPPVDAPPPPNREGSP